ncbi:CBO0543 family protein [Sporosarcina sp. FSL K6-6792]|uniref:CBO0543 family protein n=1 Tax=Sporosarcina sp. FSL K6-6792 TaxID=2921559 RepID=UPI0030FA2480
MNIVKHLKGLNSPLSRKRLSSRNAFLYLPSILVASLLGTYLDLYFVGKQLYQFPVRPFPDVFSINIVFTLIILPMLIGLYLYLVDKMSKWSRLIFTFFLSALVPFIEKKSMQLGFFYHENQWNHIYSFIGYFLFLLLIWKIFEWVKSEVRNS